MTGAASGMGRSTALLFADEGARVAVIDRDVEGAVDVAGLITKEHGADSAAAWTTDLASVDELPRVVNEIVERLGPIDILVNNAGV
ncbi:MAG TPA: SDR family NAD(P)-dependent oxidoreductase, partial [Acidimicrobiales bacterium]|nr:SDR family NAD(P)-dependent oxidoreductase [Acidimicrobiales bacterium]